MTASRRNDAVSGTTPVDRAALIRVARTVFGEAGAEPSVAALAEAAGVSESVFAQHFPTRESVIMAIFDENLAEIESLAAGPSVNLDILLDAVVDQVADSVAFISLMNPVTTDDRRFTGPGWRIIQLIVDRLEDPSLRGSLRADMSAADVLLALSMLSATLTKTEPGQRRVVARDAWKLLTRGLYRPE